LTERKHKTTAKELAYYESRVFHWQRVLSLGDWKVEVFDGTIEESATCEMWHNAHGAHIRLSNRFHYAPSKRFLDTLALHEVCHVLLCDMKRLINDRVCTDAMAETAEHAVIRRLENALVAVDRTEAK
jgi:hypothetical protein